MPLPKESPRMFPDPDDIDFACDADLNTRWQGEKSTKSPSQLITVVEAQFAQTRPQKKADIRPKSKS